MKKEDFEHWVNDNQSEDESSRFEADMMGSLMEFRLKNDFQARLKARRERRNFFKWGSFFLILVALIGSGFYFYMFKKDENLKIQPIELTPQIQNSIPKDTSNREKSILKNKIIADRPTKIDKTNDPLKSPNNKPEDIVDVATIQNSATIAHNTPIKQPSKQSFVTAPVDTEYVYLKTENAPLKYPFNSYNEDEEAAVYELNLSKKKLQFLPPSVFLYKNLKKLNLSNNQLAYLTDSIGALKELDLLILNSNKLTDLPKTLAECSHLTDLYLRKNRFRKLPESVFSLKNLERLDLMGNKLKKLPAEIGHLTTLKKLDLEYNTLTDLPLEMNGFSELTHLNLRTNYISEFPTVIRQLTQLEVLNLSRNRLRYVPAEIGDLQQLKTLDLSHNLLSEMPIEISKLTQLTYLDLSHNDLIELPTEIENLINLKLLKLGENRFPLSEIRKIERLLPQCKVEY